MSDCAKTDEEQLHFELGLLRTRLKVLKSYLDMNANNLNAINVIDYERQVGHYIERIEKSMFRVYEMDPSNKEFPEWCGHMDATVAAINQKIFEARSGIK